VHSLPVTTQNTADDKGNALVSFYAEPDLQKARRKMATSAIAGNPPKNTSEDKKTFFVKQTVPHGVHGFQ
jgi:hypothetical protein